MKTNTIQTKSILTKSKLPAADYVINPYVGCQHACIYCYADFMKRFTGHSNDQWGEFVDIKIDAYKSLPLKLPKNKTILIGSVTDPYQQAESRYMETRKILEKLLPFQPNIEILTKSALIIRDFDLISKFSNIKIGVSLNSISPSISRCLEPFASSPKARIGILQEAASKSIPAYIFISPIFPKITDVKKIINEIHPYTNRFMFENLNLRGNNKERIRQFILKHFPQHNEFYANLKQTDKYWSELKREIEIICTTQGIDYKIFFNHKEDKKK